MDVATPTADCLDLVHDLLLPVVIKGKSKNTLSHQEVNGYIFVVILFLFVMLIVAILTVLGPSSGRSV